ncbi:MAG TPA: VOC family protein [Mariprofundaceae bacterium]|nr:VOC family protein [Mariprofundaceae bacterium]
MRLLHIGLIVSDLTRSAAFYEGILGLPRDPRPELGFDGIFYRLEAGQQIHLMRLDDPYGGVERPAHGGRDNHVALAVDDLDAICARLNTASISYTRSRSGRAAIFCRDPDGHAVELCLSV